jgi:AraC-like DNA-binding protein
MTDVLLAQAICQYRPSFAGFHSPRLTTVKDPQIAGALRLMHEQPHRAWTASALATCVAMSRSAFSARFRLVIGEPPMRYLTRYRLARAAHRLRTSGESLMDIALQTGYASDVALSTAFKRYFGISPGAFRHATQKAGERVPSDGALAQQGRPVIITDSALEGNELLQQLQLDIQGTALINALNVIYWKHEANALGQAGSRCLPACRASAYS